MKIIRPPAKQAMPPDAKKVFSGILFDVYQWEQKLYDGRTTTFEKLSRADTTVVFVVLDDGRIMLSREDQPGKQTVINAFGGKVEPGEDPLAGAKRELLEETGMEASDWTLWYAEHPTSKIDWVIYAFIAKGVREVRAPHLDGGERIEPFTVSYEEFLALASNPDFSEREAAMKMLEARVDEKKMAALAKLFSP